MKSVLFRRSTALLYLMTSLTTACAREVSVLLIPHHEPQVLRKKGQTFTIEVKALNRHGEVISNPTLSWRSTQPAVASVREGVVEAIHSGQALILAESGKAQAITMVTVSIPASLELSLKDKYIYGIGVPQELTAHLRNDAGQLEQNDPEVSWSSSDETVLRIEDGRIIPLKEGRAKITAAASGLRATHPVQVFRNRPSRVDVTHSQIVFKKPGETQRVRADLIDVGGARMNIPVEWVSSDPTVARVSSQGLIQAVRAGRTLISAVAAQRRAGILIEVANPATAQNTP